MDLDELNELRRDRDAHTAHIDMLTQRLAAVEHMAGFLNDQWRRVYPAVTGRPDDWPHPMFGRVDWNRGPLNRPGERPADWRGPGERPADWHGGPGFLGPHDAPDDVKGSEPHPDAKETFFGKKP